MYDRNRPVRRDETGRARLMAHLIPTRNLCPTCYKDVFRGVPGPPVSHTLLPYLFGVGEGWAFIPGTSVEAQAISSSADKR
jgi:hypothetical protein